MNYKTLETIGTFAKNKGITLQELQSVLLKPRQKTIKNKNNSYFSVPLNEEIDPSLIENGSYGDINNILEWVDFYISGNFRGDEFIEMINNFDFNLAKFNSNSGNIYFIEENDKYFLAEDGNHRLGAYLLSFYAETAKAKTVQEKSDVLKKYTFRANVIHSSENEDFVKAFNTAVEKTSRNTNDLAVDYMYRNSYSRGNNGNFYFYDKNSKLYTVSVGGYVFLNISDKEAISLMKSIKKVPAGVSCFQSPDGDKFCVTCRNQVFECEDTEEVQMLIRQMRNEAPERFKSVEKECLIINNKDGSLSLDISRKIIDSTEYNEEGVKQLTELRQYLLEHNYEDYKREDSTKRTKEIIDEVLNDNFIHIPARRYDDLNYTELLEKIDLYTKECEMIKNLKAFTKDENER
ncbi:MAG: hypothetical protein RR334_01870 [Clostridia bacterium]